jgi:hypothetical protein
LLKFWLFLRKVQDLGSLSAVVWKSKGLLSVIRHHLPEEEKTCHLFEMRLLHMPSKRWRILSR